MKRVNNSKGQFVILPLARYNRFEAVRDITGNHVQAQTRKNNCLSQLIRTVQAWVRTSEKTWMFVNVKSFHGMGYSKQLSSHKSSCEVGGRPLTLPCGVLPQNWCGTELNSTVTLPRLVERSCSRATRVADSKPSTTDAEGVPPNAVRKLGREVENIVRSHTYIGKHRRNAVGGAVRELTRSAQVVSSLQTWTACDEHESFYEHRVGGYPLHLRHCQQKWTCCCLVVWGKISNGWGQPNHQAFARVHQNLVEHISFKITIDATPVNSEMDLVARISLAPATIRVLQCSRVWGEALKIKMSSKYLRRIQRRILLRVICGYRTISYDSVYAISGFPPIDITIRHNIALRENLSASSISNYDCILSAFFLPHLSERNAINIVQFSDKITEDFPVICYTDGSKID
ncbi:RNase H domain-containing protein [Trichonephila clavipes]|nr:RNase H domain-containing protein [Trichonephila clavipes]